MTDKLQIIKQKILGKEELGRVLSYWSFTDKKVVFTNGCFDIIHRGHIEYLAKAASLGDVLVVGLNTDSSVKKLKGKNRPLQDELSRALLLAALHFVNVVVLFEEETPFNLISFIQPDVLVKGGDYSHDQIVGANIVEKKNGKVVTIEFVEGFSSSNIISRMKSD